MINVFTLIAAVLYLLDIFLFVPKYTKCKYDHTPRTTKLVWKGICIGIPFLVLTAGLLKNHILVSFESAPFLIWVAMLLCAFGDIILEIRFIKGGILFLTGHMVFVIAFLCLVRDIHLETVIVFLILSTIGCILTVTRLDKKYRYYLFAYNFMISASFALGITTITRLGGSLILLGVGVCFLVISDWLLARNKKLGSTFCWSLVSLEFYFIGQILISTLVL